MSWDTWAFWLPKAEAIYYFHGLDTGLGGFTTFANPQYPPLVPVIDAASFHFMGGFYPALLPLQQCLVFVGFITALPALLRSVPRWIVYPLLAMLALAYQLASEVLKVMPDQELAYLLGLAAVCGILWLERDRAAFLVLAAIFLAGAALTKDEGVLLGLLLAVSIIAAGFAMRGRRAVSGFFLLLGPLALLPWRFWLESHHQPGLGEGRLLLVRARSPGLPRRPDPPADLRGRPHGPPPRRPDPLVADPAADARGGDRARADAARPLRDGRRLDRCRLLRPRDASTGSGRPTSCGTSRRRPIASSARCRSSPGAVLPLLLGIALARERRERETVQPPGSRLAMRRVRPALAGRRLDAQRQLAAGALRHETTMLPRGDGTTPRAHCRLPGCGVTVNVL